MSFLQRRQAREGEFNGDGVYIARPQDMTMFPALLEFLTASRWPDGVPRQPGTLLMFFDQGKCKACLSDRDQSLVGFVTADGLADAILTVEHVLAAGEVDWRPMRPKRK